MRCCRLDEELIALSRKNKRDTREAKRCLPVQISLLLLLRGREKNELELGRHALRQLTDHCMLLRPALLTAQAELS